MAERLPPLTAIRYFEAAARHLSFTKAALELHVTHSAISHQIKALEEWLGVPLFRRMNRTIVLTEAGQAYMRPGREALDRLAEAARVPPAREPAGAPAGGAVAPLAPPNPPPPAPPRPPLPRLHA